MESPAELEPPERSVTKVIRYVKTRRQQGVLTQEDKDRIDRERKSSVARRTLNMREDRNPVPKPQQR